jgi:hypothetical protein
LVCGRRAASCRFGSLVPGITIQQGICKRSFAKVAGRWITASWRAGRSVGQGVARWAWPYRGTTAARSRRIYRSLWLKSVPKADVAHPGGWDPSVDGAPKQFQALGSPGNAKSYLPRLNRACHNLVKRLESQHESCYGRVTKELRRASPCRRDEVAGLIMQVSRLVTPSR